METYKRLSSSWIMITSLFMWLLSSGCASKPILLEGVLDSPEHHVFNGYKLMKKGRLGDAEREFKLALEYAPQYSSAHRGIGLVYGMKKQFKPAFDSMDRAREYAKGNEDEALTYVGLIRLYTMQKGVRWLDKAENAFRQAVEVFKELPEAYFHMGIAFKEAYRFSDAEKYFQRVVEMSKALLKEANQQIEIIQKVRQAMPSSELGRRIVFWNRITRAEVAALFINELKLKKVYERVQVRHSRPSTRPLTVPIDVKNHMYRSYIEQILHLDIQGLRPYPDGTFGPDEYITRASYAVMIANIVATIEKDPSLSTRYMERSSPYKDVRNDNSYFNAVMVCTEKRLITEAEGEIFNPMGGVSGADALLVIKKLKKGI